MDFNNTKSKRAEKLRRDRAEKNEERSFLAFERRPKRQRNPSVLELMDESDWTAVE